MEHLATFGLSRDPFANEPRADGFFASAAHQDAERRLARAVRQGKGLVLLLGEPGSGKTLLIRRLLESLEEEMFEVCMLVPVPGVSDGHWVMDRLCRQLGEESPSADPAGLLGQLYDHLATVREDGRHTVVLVDESQVLADAQLLAGLRGLLNLEYEERRLMTLVLTGSLEFGALVAREPALASRVEARVCVAPMDAASAEEYLHHRIRAADGNPAILESSAVDALVKHAAGNPRRLNDLADGALFEAHVAGRVAATAEDVSASLRELGMGAAEAPAGSAPAPVIQPARSPELLGGVSGGSTSRPPDVLTPAEELYSRLPESDGHLPAARAGAPDATTLLATPGGADVTTLLSEAGESGDDDLGSLLADAPAPQDAPAGPRGAAPDATVALVDGAPLGASERPVAPSGGPAETVALFAEPAEVEGEGELDDLFADLVQDDD